MYDPTSLPAASGTWRRTFLIEAELNVPERKMAKNSCGGERPGDLEGVMEWPRPRKSAKLANAHVR
eukprot:2516403-Pleurochrysis_carterae.AAC.1